MKQTPSQTVGPYFAYGLTPQQYSYGFNSLANNELVPLEKDQILIKGRVFDGNGASIPDAMLEIWDAKNQLFGRFGTGTEKDNSFIFKTQKPELIHSYTRIYFSDESLNSSDPVLLQVEENRRNTLIATKHANYYEFNIFMQGENETVFFEI
jgi:protocatechuate 3,4-dioxygenase alpha subunit